MKRTRLKYLRTMVWVISAVAALLLIGFFFTKDKEYSEIENRNLQTKPDMTWASVTNGRFEARFEDYVEDQFPLRNVWIGIKSGMDRLLGKTEANNVFLSDDGYLIRNFTEPSAERYESTLNAIRGFSLAHPELEKYMLLVPSAVTVYADKLPNNAIVGDESGYIEKMKNDLAPYPIRFVDVREDFIREGAETQFYYRTDHHWTTRAAYCAYLKLALAAQLFEGQNISYTPLLVTDSFSGTLTASSGFRMHETDELYAYIPETSVSCIVTYSGAAGKFSSFYKTENLETRDKYTLFFGGNHPEVKIETSAQSKRVLLVFKDSYANCFAPFLVQDYKKIIMVDPRYYTDEVETLIKAEGVTDVLFLYNAATLSADNSLADDLRIS